jgi:hypothetical protein
MDYALIRNQVDNETRRRDSLGTDYYSIYSEMAVDSLREVVKGYPLASLRVFLKNINDNINTEAGIHHLILPEWADVLGKITSAIDKRGLHYRALLFSLIGLTILIVQRKYRPAIILGSLYIYFAFFTAFTVRQGMRIFYPGQIAWTILASYPLLYLYLYFRRAIRFLKSKK